MNPRVLEVKTCIGHLCDEILVFGSYTKNEEYNDIDILIKTDKRNLKQIQEVLLESNSLGSRKIEKFIFSYTGIQESIKEIEIEDIPLHISFITNKEEEYLTSDLWRLNCASMLQVQ